MTALPPLHAVVVAYHGHETLAACLAGLTDVDAVSVIDNSRSAQVETVARTAGASYVATEENIGFGAGVNVALRSLGPPWDCDVLLVNPDAELAPGAALALQSELHSPGFERVGAVAPRLVDRQGTPARVSWPFPSPRGMWREALGLRERDVARDRSFLIGAALLLRGAALDEVGMFDERFFLYAEETDWQRRAAALGWVSKPVPEVIAVHAGAGASTDARRREHLFHAAQETYIRKWHGASGWWSYRMAAVVGASARALALRDARRSAAVRRALLYLRGPRRVAGFGQV